MVHTEIDSGSFCLRRNVSDSCICRLALRFDMSDVSGHSGESVRAYHAMGQCLGVSVCVERTRNGRVRESKVSCSHTHTHIRGLTNAVSTQPKKAHAKRTRNHFTRMRIQRAGDAGGDAVYVMQRDANTSTEGDNSKCLQVCLHPACQRRLH